MNYKCPNCNKDAKRSYAYPNIVVCNCSGTLEEVGQLVNNIYSPLTKFIKKDELINDINLYLNGNKFFIKKINDVYEVNDCGRKLGNPFDSITYCHQNYGKGKQFEEMFFAKCEEKFYSGNEYSFMFAIKDKKIYFFGKNMPAFFQSLEIQLKEKGLLN